MKTDPTERADRQPDRKPWTIEIDGKEEPLTEESWKRWQERAWERRIAKSSQDTHQ